MEKSNHLVLGFAGYARTGKDMLGSTVKNLCAPNSVEILKLASSLREIIVAEQYCPKGIDVYSEDEEMKKKARPYLVKKAQELRKDDPDFFVKKIVEQIKQTPYDNRISVLTDIRYENEVDYLTNSFSNFEFIVLHRHNAKPASDEENNFTTQLYNVVSQYKNGSYLFIPELAKYTNGDQNLLSNQIVTTSLMAEILTYGLPDFSKNKEFILENLTPHSLDAFQTISHLNLNLRFLNENYL
jgi:hypothetical protein